MTQALEFHAASFGAGPPRKLAHERTGHEIDTSQWKFHIAFSPLRLVAISQGILKRAQDCSVNSPQALAVSDKA